MNFKNVIIFTIGTILGAVIVIISTTQNTKVHQTILKKAIEKNTSKTTNIHDIDLEVGKIKDSKSLDVNIIQKPKTEQNPSIINKCDGVELFKKLNFTVREFRHFRSNKYNTDKLTEEQRKVLSI